MLWPCKIWISPILWFMTIHSDKLMTCPIAWAELEPFSIGTFGRGESNFAALIYAVITSPNAPSYAEPLPSRWTVSGLMPKHLKAFKGAAVMSWRPGPNWRTLLFPLEHQTHLMCDGEKLPSRSSCVFFPLHFSLWTSKWICAVWGVVSCGSLCAFKYAHITCMRQLHI